MKKILIHKIFWPFLLVLPILVNAQPDQTTVAKDTVEVKESTYALFTDYRLGPRTDDSLQFDTITAKEFMEYREKYSPRIDTSSNRIAHNEKSFEITAADTTFIFRCEGYTFCHHYHGYYPDFDSYLIGVTGYEIYETFLIDKATAKGLPVPPIYDAASFNPTISPDKKYMLIYGTCGDPRSIEYYGDLSAILLVDISEVNNLHDLDQRPFKSFSTKGWVLDELLWIDGTTIAIKVCDDYSRYGEPMNLKFLKARIK